jgi:tungstate transport system substrate-binding protein
MPLNSIAPRPHEMEPSFARHRGRSQIICSMPGSWYAVGFALLVLATFGISGCTSPGETIILATTTSTHDSGLLDVLVPRFTNKTGIHVKVIAVGTGQALQIARRGDADVVLVHDPAAEKTFMDEGQGSFHSAVMHNDFILVGPTNDPAGVRSQKNIDRVFERIAQAQSPFLSRGDESGTHQKEKAMWKRIDIEPQGDWYISAATGMGQLLRMAHEKRAYALADRGTFLSQRDKLELAILFEGGEQLANPYSVIVVNPELHRNLRSEAARAFADFLIGSDGQKIIANFGRDKYGQSLFVPHHLRRGM